jgi:class 3 adenylate cyclase
MCPVRGEIEYARNGGVAIAYQVVGDGDTDLIYVPDYVSNLVYVWESPDWTRFFERLAQTFRLILFDKRGTGLSDHGPGFAALETRMEDMRTVLDAVGSSRTVVLGSHEGCGMASLFAATYPERTRALALFHPVTHGPGTHGRAEQEDLSELRERWGTRDFFDQMLNEEPERMTAETSRWYADFLRVSASPEVAYALNRAFFETDLRQVLPAVRVPALVLYRRASTEDTEAAALSVAELLPSARSLRLSGDSYFGIHGSPEIVDELERFVAGEEAPALPTSVLTTVMFTDLVGSTERATALGDRAWRELLAAHHGLVRRELGRYRGEERDTAGDGFFATFEGPARAIRAAQAIVDGLRGLGLEARIGIHVGECELHDDKPTGVAVVIGARVAGLAEAGEVLVTRTVRDLVAGSGLDFTARGSHVLKGVPGTWELFALADEAPTA